MITLRNAAKTFLTKDGRPVPAVKGVDFHVARGEFVIVTGRSGSGKTTLLNLAAGLARPTAGEVWLCETNLWGLPDHEQARLRNQKIGFIFQFPSLLPSLSVLENVLLPLSFGANGSGDMAERGVRLLRGVGLEDKRDAFPRQLSAGQQQRVVIARSLINHPEILLADEPTSNLDEQTEQEIMAMLREIHASMGITIVMVTHTSQLVSCGTRSVEMADGAIRRDTNILPREPDVVTTQAGEFALT